MSKESPKSLPLDKAYEFANEHKLEAQAQKIQNFKFDDDVSPAQARRIRKGMLIHLFERKAIYPEFVNKYWPYGSTTGGQTIRKYYDRVAFDYLDGDIDTDTEDAEDDEVETSTEFAMETHFRDVLAKGNELNKIEAGLKIYNREGKLGVEYAIDDGKGRIDILAINAAGKFVIIELKRRKGSRRAMGQLLYYMGWVDANIGSGTKPCRGIVVANDIPEELKLAVSQVPRVKLARYKMNFSIEYV